MDILPNFDKQDMFLPLTVGQLFNAKIAACKIIQQGVFGNKINKMKKTGADYLTAFQKTVHDPNRRNMLASIAGLTVSMYRWFTPCWWTLKKDKI